ncbi:MAG: DUF1489 domain-containing protein [Alphaproteobacteria bacterium]|nr:DUF1489 domain-containing protein [Alphaproteobacteria bacterium]
MTLHLIKMAVGVSDLAELRKLQKLRRKRRGRSVFFTRNMPKRIDELLDGGSIFWVIKRQVAARQRLKGFMPFVGKDGKRRVAVEYAMKLVPVMPRPCRPFQGWRYLGPADAPRDRPAGVDSGERLPPKLARELRDLGLL